jgi:uncharacterized protein
LADEDQKNVTGPDTLLAAARATGQRGLPPVHLWNPPHCGMIDMRIARDGTWFYLGTPIGRLPMVRLFSTILRRDPDGYVLVTPVERVGITVEDAPFVAVDFDVTDPGPDQIVTFRTNVDDLASAGPANPLRLSMSASGEPSPYVLIRSNLEALIDRKSFYRLMEFCSHAEIDGDSWFGLRSQGSFCAFQRSDEL